MADTKLRLELIEDITTANVTDFDTEVSNNTSVVANTAKRSYPTEDETKLSNIEENATADQTDAEIETAYNNQVDVVSQAEAEAGTATTVRRWTAQRVKQAIEALASATGLSNVVEDTTPQLGGDLDVNGNNIVSTSNADINIIPDGTGAVGVGTNDPTAIVASSKLMLSSDDPNNSDFGTSVHTNTVSAYGAFIAGRSRGTEASPTTVQDGDGLGALLPFGYDGTNYITSLSDGLYFEVDGTVSTGTIPIKMMLKSSSGLIEADARFDYKTANGTVSTLGNLGTSQVIDFAVATHFTGTLDNNVTITHSNQNTGQSVTLYLSYSGAQRTITWSDVDTWLDSTDGSAPAAPITTGDVLVVTLQNIGGTVYASPAGNYTLY